MKPKIFYFNDKEEIIFTKEQLEKLINDVYEEGRLDGIETARPYAITYKYEGQPLPCYYNLDVTNPADKAIIKNMFCTNDTSGRIHLEALKGE